MLRKIKLIPSYLKNKIINFLFIQKIRKYFTNKRQINFYKKYVGQNKLVFDIGANIGTKTYIFLKTGSKVVAVEPQSELAKKLKETYKENKNVYVEECGIGKNEGEAIINISSKYPGFSSIKKDWQKGTKYDHFDRTEKIKINTLDNLIKKYGLPDFCKIDVEGFEYEVLSGLSTKIPLLNFEFHSNDKELIKKCLSRLGELGYREHNFILFENSIMQHSHWLSTESIISEIEKIEQAKKKVIWGDVYSK